MPGLIHGLHGAITSTPVLNSHFPRRPRASPPDSFRSARSAHVYEEVDMYMVCVSAMGSPQPDAAK
jgi:hypothetical protein